MKTSNGLSIAGFVVSLGSLFLGLWGLTVLVGVALSAVSAVGYLFLFKSSMFGVSFEGCGLPAWLVIGIIGAVYCWIMLIIALS